MTKPQTLAEQIRAQEGPQHRALKTCKGCCHFKSEYWREPSGDGETYDSGTSADCLKAGRSICSYGGSEPAPPDWCPCAALEPDPTPVAMPEWGTSEKTQHYAAMVADTNDADILRVAISDLCRDNERLAVMLKSAKQPDPTPPTALSGPPKDGRMLCLLVDYSDGDHPLEDAKQAWTIGYNTLADTGEDEWLIAGWDWEQDCYTDGRGTVIGWLPFPCDTTPALGWRAMQTAAVGATDWEAHVIDNAPGYLSDWQRGLVAGQQAMAKAIRALPGPSDEQALAEAVKLPEVQAVVVDMREVRLAVNAIEGKEKLDRELITAISARIDAALTQIGGDA